MRKKRGADGKREFKQPPVPCPQQNKDYSKICHCINKGNDAEAKYDMGGASQKHNWTPKIVMRLFSINMNNAYKLYKRLVSTYTPGGYILAWDMA